MPDTATIVIHSETGENESKLIETAQTLYSFGLLKEFALIRATSTAEFDVNVEALIIGDVSKSESCLRYLSQKRELTHVVIAAIGGQQNEEMYEDLQRKATQLQEYVELNSPSNLRVHGARIFVPTWKDTKLPDILFSTATSNFVVIPEDRASEQGVARPIEDDSDFIYHFFYETIALLGLWQGMSTSAVLLSPPNPPGVPDSVVHFFRSFVRVLRGPAPPLSEILPSGNSLPIPPGFIASADQELAVRRLSQAILPTEFRFQDLKWEDPRTVISRKDAISKYAKEFTYVVKRMPRVLRKGFLADLDETAGVVVQSLYGEHSWIHVDGSQTEVEANQLPELEEIQSLLDASIERPNLNTESNSCWKDLVDNILGSVDGSDRISEIREEHIGTKTLLNGRDSLAWEPETTPKNVYWHLDEVQKKNDSNESQRLLNSLTSQFVRQISRAEDQIVRSINSIRRSRHEATQIGRTITALLIGLLVVSLLLLVWGVVSLTQLHSAVSLDSVSGLTRSRIWILLTASIFLIAGVTVPLKDPSKRQLVLGAGIAVYAGIVGATLIYLRPIRRSVRESLGSNSDLPIYLGSLAVFAFVIWAVIKSWRSGGPNSASFRVLSIALVLYGFFSILVASCREESLVQNISRGERQRLLIFLCVAVLVIVAGVLIAISYYRVRERNQFNYWLEQLRWSMLTAEDSMRQRKELTLRLTQWIGTACALNYLLWYPLGKEPHHQNRLKEMPGLSSLQKTQIADIQLTDDGYSRFVSRVRAIYATPGWLTGQYSKVSRTFARKFQIEAGVTTGTAEGYSPESCSYPQTKEQVESGELNSRRWKFAEELTSGRLDASLRTAENLRDVGKLYSALLESPDSYSLSGNKLDIKSFLEDTAVLSSDLPAGFLGERSFVDPHGRRLMESTQWWPNDLGIGSSPGAVETETVQMEDGIIIFSGRIDISEGFKVSELSSSIKVHFEPSESELDLDL